eukprot:1875902-Prorocentrum_lima.AAC.1
MQARKPLSSIAAGQLSLHAAVFNAGPMSAGAQLPSSCICASPPWLHPLRRGTPRRPCLA